jgi:hypothetical protein
VTRPEIPPDAQIAPDPEWPRPLRARARRCRVQLERLDQVLRADYPEGATIAHDPWLAEHIDTSPCDHSVAEVLVRLKALLATLEDLC